MLAPCLRAALLESTKLPSCHRTCHYVAVHDRQDLLALRRRPAEPFALPLQGPAPLPDKEKPFPNKGKATLGHQMGTNSCSKSSCTSSIRRPDPPGRPFWRAASELLFTELPANHLLHMSPEVYGEIGEEVEASFS